MIVSAANPQVILVYTRKSAIQVLADLFRCLCSMECMDVSFSQTQNKKFQKNS
jgi:hypothetical protein